MTLTLRVCALALALVSGCGGALSPAVVSAIVKPTCAGARLIAATCDVLEPAVAP